MYLTKLWWQLRANNLLTYARSENLLKTIEVHGTFLADRNHYQKGFNHGVNEAIALYLVAVNFPDLDKGGAWERTALSRLDYGLRDVIDEDGLIVDNSPY